VYFFLNNPVFHTQDPAPVFKRSNPVEDYEEEEEVSTVASTWQDTQNTGLLTALSLNGLK
jgi:hypothetical protein